MKYLEVHYNDKRLIMKKGIFIKYIQFYRLLWNKNYKLVAKILAFINRSIFSCDIPPTCIIKENVKFPHYGLGVVLHPRTIIGEGCTIYQNVTIGSRNGEGPPKIGDNVYIGAGACILGDISIGNNVKIGANAVVLKDIPDNCCVVGILGKILPNK